MAPMRQLHPGLFVWNQLRTPDQYQSLEQEIDQLRSLELATVDDRTLANSLNTVGNGYATRTMWSVPTTSFRASRPTSIDDPWSHLDDLWAPPAKYATRGRFNEDGKPVLYISSDPNTALMEIQPKPYDLRVVLVLRKRRTKKVIHFVQLGLELLPEAPITRNALGDIKDGLKEEPVLKDILLGQRIYTQWCKQDAYLSEVCTRFYNEDESRNAYRLTNAIAKQLQKIKHVEGISYPTVANNYRGQNVAMPVNVARRNLFPLQAWLVHFGGQIDPPGSGPRRYEGSVVRIGAFDDRGNILWGPKGNWSPEDLHLSIAPAPKRGSK